MPKRSRDQMQETEKQDKYFVDKEKRQKRKHTSVEKPQERVLSETGSESSPPSNSHVRTRRTNIKNKIYTDAFLKKCDSSRQSREFGRERPFSCHKCGTSFVSNYHLSRHTLIHTGEKLFTCETCSKSFYRKDHLNKHKRMHTGETPFSCDICSRRFTTKFHLDRHRKTVHVTKHPQEKQDELPVSNKLNDLFTKHTPEKHLDELPVSNTIKDTTANSRSCSKFFKSFREKYNLQRHRLIHKTEENFTCTTCFKPFSRKSHLKRHREFVTFTCIVCLQSFCGQAKYPTYIEKHTGKKASTCLICLKKYPLNRDLIEHYRTHLRINVCNFCTKTFTRRRNLERHMRAHTKGQQKTNEQSFVCKICFKTFPVRSALAVHSFFKHPRDRQTLESQATDSVPRSAQSKDSNTSCICSRCHESISRMSTTHSNISTRQSREKGNPSERTQSSSKTLNPRLNNEESSQNNMICSKMSNLISDFVASSSERDRVDSPISHDTNSKSTPLEKTKSVRMTSRNVKKQVKSVHGKIKLPPEQKDIVKKCNRVKIRSANTSASTSVCKICFKSFYSESNLVRHNKLIHKTDGKRTQTERGQRQSTFSRVSNLYALSETKIERPPFRCNFCLKLFINKAGLSSHNLYKHKKNYQGVSSTTMFTLLKSEKTDFINPPRAKDSRGQHSGGKRSKLKSCKSKSVARRRGKHLGEYKVVSDKRIQHSSQTTKPKHQRPSDARLPYKFKKCSETFTQNSSLASQSAIKRGIHTTSGQSKPNASNAVSVGSNTNDETIEILIPTDSTKEENNNIVQPSSVDNCSSSLSDVPIISNSLSSISHVANPENTRVGAGSESVREKPSMFQKSLHFHDDEVAVNSVSSRSPIETGRRGNEEMVKLYTCNTCLMSFTDSRSLVDHLSMHAQRTAGLGEPVGLI